MLAACLHARNEMGSFFFPLIANMLFVSIKLLLAGKGFFEIFLPVLNSSAYYPWLTNLHMCNICLHVLKVSLIYLVRTGEGTSDLCRFWGLVSDALD